MGSVHDDVSKSDLLFTGCDESLPIELFIHLLERESPWDQIANVARQSIDVSLWPELEDTVLSWGPDCTWDSMKADLLSIFERQTPYTPLDISTFVRSLRKDPKECPSRFLLRVQWVVLQLPAEEVGNIDMWIRMLFLAGLEPSEASRADSIVNDKTIDEAFECIKHNQFAFHSSAR